ncbi:MAG: ABC transporter ATP-binding protein [Clostridiaceae bacterium]|nr:ABC transporter ATP-binding protein [Clostridiaceae bacterium]
MNILEVSHVWKSYKTKKDTTDVLRDINLCVGENERVAVMGPSGSGKTTLLNLISGIDRADGGEIIIDGKNTSDMKKSEIALFRRKKLGMVFQDYNLLECLNVRENILIPMALEKIYSDEQEARLEHVAKVLCISDILNKRIPDISGGQKQRAAIARAIINTPAVIIADEPTGNLDSKSAKDVMEYLMEANEKFGTSILMVTHDPFAASYCQRVILLKDGAIISELARNGSRQQFFHDIHKMLVMIGGGDQNDI